MGEAFTILSDPKKKARYDSGQDLDEDGMNMSGKCLLGILTIFMCLWFFHKLEVGLQLMNIFIIN